jgi:MFS family permease
MVSVKRSLSKLRFWSVAPIDVVGIQRKNFKMVQVDGIAIGLVNAATPFLPVFLTRLGATNFQVGLLSSMPALTGLIFSILVGRLLQQKRNVVPWYSGARLMVVSCFAATGLAPFIVPPDYLVVTVLLIWAVATLPQTIVAVGFSVVMNAVAGPNHRYDLMSRRWSILGLTTAITVSIVGQVLEWFRFPINYQVVFIGLSLAGLISFYFSRQIEIPEIEPPPRKAGMSIRQNWKEYFALVRAEKPFIRFSLQRFVYLFGISLAAPLFPLYYVRIINATDAQIGMITTTVAVVMVVGYSFWTRASRKRGSRLVLLTTTLGLSLYPALISSTEQVPVIILIAGFAGVFQSGLDLVFFDELMRTVPPAYSATFVSLAQSVTYFSSFVAPLIGTALATSIGIPGALVVSSVIRLLGFALFAFWK